MQARGPQEGRPRQGDDREEGRQDQRRQDRGVARRQEGREEGQVRGPTTPAAPGARTGRPALLFFAAACCRGVRTSADVTAPLPPVRAGCVYTSQEGHSLCTRSSRGNQFRATERQPYGGNLWQNRSRPALKAATGPKVGQAGLPPAARVRRPGSEPAATIILEGSR